MNRKGKDLGGEEGIETSTRSLNLYIFYHYSDLLHSMAREIVTTAINPIFPLLSPTGRETLCDDVTTLRSSAKETKQYKAHVKSEN